MVGEVSSGSPSVRRADGSALGAFGSSVTPLAALHDVALLDLDGVVYVGTGAVPHAAEALDAALAEHGMRSAFVTNNAARTPATVAAHLVDLGVRAAPSDVVTSAQAGARMLAERLPVGSHVLVIGGPGVGAALRERGLVPVESVDDGAVALMQGYGPDVGWRQLAEGSLAIVRGAALGCHQPRPDHPDPARAGPRQRVDGRGAPVRHRGRAAGGREARAAADDRVGRSDPGAVRPIVVGDRLDTDIEGANRSGIPSLLVLTGVTDWQDLLHVAPPYRPTYLGPDLRALLSSAPAVEVRWGTGVVEGRCGAVAVRIPTGGSDGGARRPGASVGSDRGQPELSDLWWLPESLRDASGGADSAPAEIDLDVVRAVVAATWSIADAGAAITGPAHVHAATG